MLVVICVTVIAQTLAVGLEEPLELLNPELNHSFSPSFFTVGHFLKWF